MPAGLLGIEELDRAEIEAILARAKQFQPVQDQSQKKLDTLRGKMIVNLFFEASTRTRTSFEIAAKRSEEHTSERQSLRRLVCRLLLEKKKGRRPHVAVDSAGERHIEVVPDRSEA